MESSTEAADSAAHTFSQVVFTDIPHTYPPSTSVTCCFNLTASFQPNSRDWVGVFKVGWSTTKDYHTFVWVEPCVDVEGQQSVTRQAVFKDYYLPKDENEFYQFCYVDNSGQVRGASTPFCFRNPVDMSLEIIPEDDLLVITTQDQVDQSVREKAELQRELDQKMAENETLRTALKQEQQEAAKWKEQKETDEKEKSQLVKELDQMMNQNKDLNNSLRQQLKENEELMVKMGDQLTEQMQQDQQLEEMQLKKLSDSLSGDGGASDKEKHAQEKYDRAVAKINQLKAEREELRGKVDTQSLEVTTLNSKVREQERELLKIKDSVQLLQVDLQTSEKEKERLQTVACNTDDLKRENQELTRRLSQMEKLQSYPDDDLRGEIQALGGKLHDTQGKLAAEREEARTAKRKAQILEGELQDVREQLRKVSSIYEEAQRMTSKLELKFNDAHELILEKDCIIEEKDDIIKLETQEKEELARENQSLMRDIEGLRRLNTELQASPHVKPPQAQPEASFPPGTAAATPEWEELETPEQEEHQYETIASIANPEDEQPSLVCRHCQESFPGITPEELEQHEQSHRVCPFCTMICDTMEQAVFEDHVYGHEL
ncbi:calcium-binding and coiled-coil domain-containing protein 2 isoform X1 [Labrus bergylta]|uniref:calcium-binding and coiled-coil domain-containing protein 2 isoform X1 n=1 Tax=Labrus bergylta TaxID=56723 RepID=UPI00331411C7